MSSQVGEEAPNNDSSGDVVIENWSDDDSDVICIDSPEKDNEKNVVKKAVLTRNDDSDDCEILEDESIDNQMT